MATYKQTCSHNKSYSLRLELSESNVSITANTSVINYALYLDSTYPRFENWNVTYKLNLGSEVNINTTKLMSMPATRKQPLLLVSGSKTVTHHDDGSKSLSVFCSVSTETSQEYLPGSASISGQTFFLTTIARKSTMSNVSGTIGSPITLSVSRKNSGFTHTIKYKFGSASGTIATKSSSTSINWTPPLSLYLQIIGSSTGRGTVTIETFNGSSSLGTNSYSLTLNAVKTYNPPSVFNLTYERGSGNSDDTWVSNPNGSDLRVKYTVSITSGIPGNTTTLTVKLGNTTIHSQSDASSGNYTHYKQGIGTSTTYIVAVTISDTIGASKNWNLTIATIEVPFDINVGLPGLACGKVAESAKTFEFAEGWKLKFGQYSMVDFIIEQGTSGDWSYRKWNSGVSECWCLHTDTNVSISNKWGSLYESSRMGNLAYPPGLFSEPPVCTLQVQNSPQGAILSLEIMASGASATSTPYWAYTRVNVVTGMTITVGVHAVGKWK